jgi:uncharacterized protein involved in exopolysaccharide biosynthesis
MDDDFFSVEKSVRFTKYTPKDVLTIAFRRRRWLIACVATTVIAAVLGAWLLPRYKGEAKILIMRERVDPVVTPAPEQSTFAVSAQPVVSDEELKSEVDMLTSYDLVRDVVRSAHPEQTAEKHPFKFLFAWQKWLHTPAEQEGALVEKVINDLNVDSVKGSDTILVEYKNHDREVAKRVLDRLIELYTQRHLLVHRPMGQYNFFEQQAVEYKKNLDQAEAKLSEFPVTSGVVNPAADRDILLQKLGEFQAALHQAEVSISDTKDRINDLQGQMGSTPDRITTQLKRSDNPQLLEQLKNTLLNLELKRIDLLTKFQPDYRPVKEVEKEIANTQAAIRAQESAPVQEQTTDVDPTHQWVVGELAKAKADLAGLEARRTALVRTVTAYEANARDLDQKAIIQHDLQRDANSQESKYLMYERKREEARVDDALDKQRMLNIAIAEPPTVPALPSHSPLLFAVIIFATMTLLSVGTFWMLEHFDPTLRTTSEVEAILDIPVFAAVPYQYANDNAKGPGNGYGNGNGRHETNEEDGARTTSEPVFKVLD